MATYHYDIRAVQAVEEGSLQIDDDGHPTDWKLYLVQVIMMDILNAFTSIQEMEGMLRTSQLFIYLYP